MAKKKTATGRGKETQKAPKKAKKIALLEPHDNITEVIDVEPVATSKKITAKQNSEVKKEILPVKPTPTTQSLISTTAEKSITSTDPLITYLNEIRKYPLLTPQEEHELAVKYKESGDKQAAEKLVTSNLRFVVKIAAEYSRFGAKMIDLIQEGNVGLMHAVKEFNPYKGVRLITYAVWWIKGYIREYLMKQHSMVRIGTTQAQKKLFYNLQQESRKLEALGEEAAVELLSERLGVSEKDVIEMKQRLASHDVSLDQPLDEESQTRLMTLQKDEVTESPEEAMISSEQTNLLKEKLDQVLPLLNPKEKFILEARLLADEPITLQEVGDKFNITRERARQLEARVLSKIKSAFDANSK